MELTIQSGVKRSIVLIGACVVSAIIIFQAVELWVADRHIESGRLDLMQRGAQLLPGNGEAWDRVGRFWQLDFSNPDPNAAVQNYQKAVRDDPNSSFYWMDLASAYEDVGNLPEAQRAFDKAESVYPISALVAWNYGNFLVRVENYQAGYGKIQKAVRTDPMLLPLAISRTWRSTESVDDLLNQVLPAAREAYLQALTFFTSIRRPDLGLQVWQRLIALHRPFAIADTVPFQDSLIAADRADDERQVWRGALEASGRAQDEPSNGSVIWNGDFARDFTNGGLDWRWMSPAGVVASFDSPGPSKKGRSIRLEFGGGSNISLEEPAQVVPVTPGRTYHFHGWLRTEQITTESGVQISIIDPNHANAVNWATDNFTGTHAWTAIDEDVTASPQTHFLLVRLLRNPSRLFENKISGTVWLSDVSFTDGLAAEGRSR
jgi:tetratricopeptide (TPR) repeat protein